MGMCSHDHDNADDPSFSLSCYPKGDGQLHVIIERCPEMTHAETALIARILAHSLGNLAEAELIFQAQEN